MHTARNDSGMKSRTKPWVRARRIMLMVIFLAFVIPCGVLVALKVYSERNLAGHIAAIRAEGDPVSFDEAASWREGIILKDVDASSSAPEENGATAAKLYQQAFATLDSPDDPHPLENLREILTSLEQDGTLPPEKLEEIATELAANAAVLEMLHQGAGLPPGNYDSDYTKGRDMELPYVPGTRRAFLLLRSEAVDAAFKQEPEHACNALTSAMALLRPLYHEPLLSSQGARDACNKLICGILSTVLARVTFTEEQLARLQAAFHPPAIREVFSNALVMEQVWGIQVYSNPVLLAGVDKDWEVDKESASTLLEVSSSLGLFIPDRNRYFDGMRELIAGIRLPYPESQAVFDRIARDVDPRRRRHLTPPPGDGLRSSSPPPGPPPGHHRHRPPLPSFSKSLSSDYNSMPLQVARDELCSQQCAAAIAIERYRLSKGAFPERLEELTPAYLPATPVDPFDLQPLRYLQSEKGYILYSVGINGKDDGGMPGKNLGEGDLAFQVQH